MKDASPSSRGTWPQQWPSLVKCNVHLAAGCWLAKSMMCTCRCETDSVVRFRWALIEGLAGSDHLKSDCLLTQLEDIASDALSVGLSRLNSVHFVEVTIAVLFPRRLSSRSTHQARAMKRSSVRSAESKLSPLFEVHCRCASCIASHF